MFVSIIYLFLLHNSVSLSHESALLPEKKTMPNCNEQQEFLVEAIETSPVCDLGEGPHWHLDQSSLYYVDAFMGFIHRYQLNENRHSKVNLGDIVTIVIPILNDNHLLISLRNKV